MGNKQKISPDRIRRLRTTLGLSQSDFAEILGVSRNYVGMLERGTQIVGADTSIGILFEMIEADPRNAANAAFTGEAKNPNVSDLSDSPAVLGEEVGHHKAGPRQIPVIGWAHAGQAATYDELPADWQRMIPTDCRDPKAFGVTLEGDSMEPLFRDGDLLVLMPSERIHNGCLAVVRLASDGVLLRRVELRGSRIRLVPLNRESYEVEEHELDQISWAYPVWGRWSQVWK